MPFTISGELKFVALDDLGAAGPRRGEPVVVYHNILWNILSVLPYLAIAVLLVLAANRSRSILWVIAPGAVVLGAFELLVWASGMPSNSSPIFRSVVLGCCAGLTVLLLRDYRAAGQPRGFRAWLSALVWGAGAGLCVAAIALWGSWDAQSIGALIFLPVLFVGLLSAVAVARLAVRGRFTAFRFVIGSLIGVGVLTAVLSALVIVPAILMSPGNSNLLEFAQMMIPVTIIGIALLGILMPYEVTALAVPLLRTRLQAALGVGDAVEAARKAELTKLELD